MIGGGKVKFKTKAINAELLGNLTKVLLRGGKFSFKITEVIIILNATFFNNSFLFSS